VSEVRPLAAIDWPTVLDEIATVLGDIDPATGRRVPVSVVVLAESLGVARGTLRGWLDGSEPRHQDGERLLDRWCTLTGKARAFAPRDVRPLPATAR